MFTNDFILTLDVDWAPDWVVEYVANLLIKHKVKATWFITHDSLGLNYLKKHNQLFELGIHPNVLPGSSHGVGEEKVLEHIKNIVPEAVSMRTHGLYQSTKFLVKANQKYGIKRDVSLFLPLAESLRPHKFQTQGSDLLRIPYFWEDDREMFMENPLWEISDARLKNKGLKIFNFHPIHLVLNTENFLRYEKLKSIIPIQDWDEKIVKVNYNKGQGPKTLFIGLLELLSGKGKKIQEINFSG